MRQIKLSLRAGAAALIVALGLAAAPPVSAQTPSTGTGAAALRIHVTSSVALPDLAREIPFATFAAAPADAQVRIEITSAASPLGETFTLALTGQSEFRGQDNLLTWTAPAGTAPDAIRGEIARTLRLGLVRYVLKTPAAKRLSLSFQDAVKPTAVSDPWDFWVFSLGVDGFLNGEQTYRSEMWSANLSAQRVTPEWKLRAGFGANWQSSRYDVEGYSYESATNSQSFTGILVRSLGEHWSIGGFLRAESSTFNNLKMNFQASPAIEYDLFPYSASTTKQLRFLYTAGPKFGWYREETIFDKMKETLWAESLSATLDLKQSWGTLNATLEASHYFHDLSKNRLSLEAGMSIRVFKGLSFNLEGGGARIHDQLSLPKGGATLEEVLLQRRQMETTYSYFFMAGFSVSFGSVNSNVVNPRFGSGSGGTSISISY